MKSITGWRSGKLLALLFAIYCLLLGYGLFRPEPPPALTVSHYDKLEHLLAFAILGLGARLLTTRRMSSLLWISLLLLAPLLEWLQGVLQPARQFSTWDAGANLLGILIAIALWSAACKLYEHMHPPSGSA